jgi:hypothetical protein
VAGASALRALVHDERNSFFISHDADGGREPGRANVTAAEQWRDKGSHLLCGGKFAVEDGPETASARRRKIENRTKKLRR